MKRRLPLRDTIIATIGHRPMWLSEIVSLCGPHRDHVSAWRSVRRELARLRRRGLIAKVGVLYAAGDGWVRERGA